MFGYPKRPEEGVILPRARVIGSCEPPLLWVLGTERRSSRKARSALYH